jgi:hypothetical protein
VSKKGKSGGRFELRLEYGWAEMEDVDRVVNEAVNDTEGFQILERGVTGSVASTHLGRFPNKSAARRLGEKLKGKLGEKVAKQVELRIRESR